MDGIPFWGDENVSELEVEVVVTQHCDVLKATELFTLNWVRLCHVNFT